MITQKYGTSQSLTESIDTTTSAGKMMMQMVGVFAEFERNMLRERTQKGLEYAKGQGRIGGGKPKLKAIQIQEIMQLYASGKPALELSELFNVHQATIYRILKKN